MTEKELSKEWKRTALLAVCVVAAGCFLSGCDGKDYFETQQDRADGFDRSMARWKGEVAEEVRMRWKVLDRHEEHIRMAKERGESVSISKLSIVLDAAANLERVQHEYALAEEAYENCKEAQVPFRDAVKRRDREGIEKNNAALVANCRPLIFD